MSCGSLCWSQWERLHFAKASCHMISSSVTTTEPRSERRRQAASFQKYVLSIILKLFHELYSSRGLRNSLSAYFTRILNNILKMCQSKSWYSNQVKSSEVESHKLHCLTESTATSRRWYFLIPQKLPLNCTVPISVSRLSISSLSTSA